MAAVLLWVCSAFVVWMCYSVQPTYAKGDLCPSSCECPVGNSVDCEDRGLDRIPEDIPVWATRLELQSNSITEIRPDDLKGLTALEHLDLSVNKINVINGSVFRDLTALKTLKLDSNQLTEIPRFPSPMNITKLTMFHNHVVEITFAAMSQMPELVSLDLSKNNILKIANGSFPQGSKLTHLILNNNKIIAIDKGSLSNLTLLETLKINKNEIMELPHSVFVGLRNLKSLELMRNEMRAVKGLTFTDLRKLQTLKLKRNSISVLKDGAFFGLHNIVNLHMDHNDIANITAGWLYGLKTLKHLSLSQNKISKIEANAWKLCKHLEKLDLANNKLKTISENSLTHLASLKSLDLDNNQISQIEEGAFRDLPKLTDLELNSNKISWMMEDGSGAFRGLDSLTTLSLRANAVRLIAVDAFAGLPRLRKLHLENNDITTIQENAFETLRELRDLQFNSSKFYCDCHLSWLPSWLKQNGFHFSATGKCFYPKLLKGGSLSQINIDDFKCNKAEFLKPVILENPKSTNGSKGENLTLTCIAAITGKSQLGIIWNKDNKILEQDMSAVTASSDGEVRRFTSRLNLRNIDDDTAGSYQCVVSNEFGKDFSDRAYLKVYVYPVFLKKPKDVTVKAGKPVELKCAATGQPTPVISWQKDGGTNFPAARERRMRVYPDDDRFYILNTRVADEGVYSCMARNDAGVVVTNASVTVLETPDFVQPMQVKKTTKRGETSVLQCMAMGSPQPKLTWLKDDQELVMTPRHFFTVDNQLLVIVDTQWSDAGIYSCRMSNSLGTAKGKTQLKVVSTTGELSESSSGSFGLDDESTTTGIIIIAVVCCVVGTSLVWVIIIYQTRKRHEVYSATPTDETTLPGEVPSSGYISSDKEGSYSQGTIPMTGYHYQDYQMKESGYESSSGQFRANGYLRPPISPVDIEDDESETPTLTAGDRLLRKMRAATSASSLQYAGSDGDTIGSRHSTSSGQHSGSSDPASSHSGQSVSPHYPLVVSIAPPTYDEYQRTLQGDPDELQDQLESRCHQQHLPSEGRPLLQTFHPTKTSHQDKLARGNNQGVGSTPRSMAGSRGPEGRVMYSKRHHSDSCDNRDLESPSPPLPHCPACRQHAMAAGNSTTLEGHSRGRTDASHDNFIPCRLHELDVEKSSSSKRQRPPISDKPPINPAARSMSSSQAADNNKKGRPPQSHQELGVHKPHARKGHMRLGSADNIDRDIHIHPRLLHGVNTHCTDCESVYPSPLSGSRGGGGGSASTTPRVATPTPCCCEVLRDSRFCPSHPQHFTQDSPGRCVGHHHTPARPSPQRHKGSSSKKLLSRMERSRSSSSVGQEPACYAHCDTYPSGQHTDCVNCSCGRDVSAQHNTSTVCPCPHCLDCQNAREPEAQTSVYISRARHKGSTAHSHNAGRGNPNVAQLHNLSSHSPLHNFTPHSPSSHNLPSHSVSHNLSTHPPSPLHNPPSQAPHSSIPASPLPPSSSSMTTPETSSSSSSSSSSSHPHHSPHQT